MKKITLSAVALAIVAMAGTAMAAGTNTLTVNANVVGTCKFSAAASTLAFGAIDPTVGANVTGSTTAQFWCTKGVVADTITANNGANWSGTSRQMKDVVSGDLINYGVALVKDANPNVGPGTPRTLTVNGSILGADYTSKTAGNYSDTVTLTINP